jgi:hypothetical protein
MRERSILSAAFLLFVLANCRSSLASAFLTYTSSPQSWVGAGRTETIDNIKAGRYYAQGAYTNAVYFSGILNGGYYYFYLVEPNYSLPTVGYFPNVTRWPFMNDGAGMAFESPGRGDNTLTGWFDVEQADYNPDGSVAAFAVDFEQYDEGNSAWWNIGSIRYNSTVPVPEPASAGLLCLGAGLVLRRRRSVHSN